MPDIGPQIAEYLDALSEPISSAEVKRASVALIAPDDTRRRWVLPAVAAVLLALLAGGVVAVVRSPDGPAEVQTGPSTTGVPDTSTSTSTVVQLGAPRWSGPLCGELTTGDDGRWFASELPPGFELWSASTQCGVLGEQMIDEEWRIGSRSDFETPGPLTADQWDAIDAMPRVLLMRVELAQSDGEPEQEEADRVTVNGKPAWFERARDGDTVASAMFELHWDQDENGRGMVLTEGVSRADTIAIAESFDASVAEHGPRRESRELTADEAIRRVEWMTSATEIQRDRAEVRRTLWEDVRSAASLPEQPDVPNDQPVWVVAGGGSGIPQNGAGDPIDHWGIVVLDARTGKILAILTGGADDGVRWPPFFDAIPAR